MGSGSVGWIFSERDRLYGGAAEQKSRIYSTPNIRNFCCGSLSGVDGCPRRYGSASLAEVLNRQTQLEVFAACACQGVIEHLRKREVPRQGSHCQIHSQSVGVHSSFMQCLITAQVREGMSTCSNQKSLNKTYKPRMLKGRVKFCSKHVFL